MSAVIEIIDESAYDKKDRLQVKHVLYVDGMPKATLTMINKTPQLNWQVYGPQQWPDAKPILQGLLELSVLADQLASVSKPDDSDEDEEKSA